MNTSTHRHAIKGREKGAALVIGLILLLVLTLLAISGMNTATLELQMAGNTQFSQNAFQAAETGIEVAIGSATLNTSGTPPIPSTLVPGSTTERFEAQVLYEPANGCSPLPTGASIGEYAQLNFDVVSRGTSVRGATSTQTQSFYTKGPGGCAF